MIPLTLTEIAAITGGAQHGEEVLVDAAVVTDSREAVPGSLYVARVGEHADGHAYVPQARAAGAVAVLGTRVVDDGPTVLVPDVQAAFAALARAVVDRAAGLTVIGITGSSGKTSTKDLLAAVLRPVGETVAPVGSYNSEVGVPLTVCRVTPSTRFLVAEMGADGEGHIAYLTRIAPPQIGIVLNVGRAHLGEFGSVEAIARTKSEMVQALSPEGLAVLNADDPNVLAMREKTSARVITVGRGADADVRATDVELDDLGRARFTARTPQGSATVSLRLLGEHHVHNALAVLAAALELGVPLAQVADCLSRAEAASRWRMELHDLPDGVTLVNDAYNANPESMAAALRALARMGAGGRRTLAVLGAMRELGADSDAEHVAVGRLAMETGADLVIAVGPGAEGIVEGAREAGADVTSAVWVQDRDAARALLFRERREGDVILLKSSRDSGLRFLGDMIVEETTEGAR
ncbi:UDP-N-acetylmuramoyl-tripeptide--D-alanyl-D-alanine ligase [Luteipulveratus sp. YIM 133132]|uniref:UDP-N-acetylmuramoyl-tripeptide--D-alanyl-D-alanine ligase n=1 Tax=Luteipulveratus flavus TaxID=3031728 RepID=A0ABT6C5P5_9MICO|nr:MULTISPECIES: UDP-N-acetylmuramoyl-tripeptide--D-alanyl-D-alanine ligase [unclassified Luteipulveratus]MDE9366487.1 UDP-N-acetylmuramoyl-tripeptide--D-alanyl-D-alanine ligase [Luteipulveratus sp. YIM 133132]MDF8264239.1 UDP-N-acetylmuramoyl-tripeptide--D-alanyl-D-alanine ligase [Luteipulveratus sp. YIM 133296]